jgi:hypothetical protein
MEHVYDPFAGMHITDPEPEDIEALAQRNIDESTARLRADMLSVRRRQQLHRIRSGVEEVAHHGTPVVDMSGLDIEDHPQWTDDEVWVRAVWVSRLWGDWFAHGIILPRPELLYRPLGVHVLVLRDHQLACSAWDVFVCQFKSARDARALYHATATGDIVCI